MRLTRRQKQIYDFVRGYIDAEGYAPTLEEIAGHFELSSLATVHKHLKNLEEKGAIERDWNRGRSMEVVVEDESAPASVEIPLLGEVAAGMPIEAVVDDEKLRIPEGLLRGTASYALRVRGWSMVDEHIADGDILIVEERKTAERGQTVIALVDGETATVKQFFPEGDVVRLQPANERMAPILMRADRVRIQGIVRGVVRRI
ncbi:MAG: repressor LexA [Gemmatimonadetes bacterium]|nr:repressor LexA [Gemmatimonadota bacterium]